MGSSSAMVSKKRLSVDWENLIGGISGATLSYLHTLTC